MLLILDNSVKKDDPLSFTKDIIKSLKKYKIPHKVVNKIQNIDDIEKKIKGIIITGSSFKLTKEENFEKLSFIIYYLIKLNVPVYGICFGCQFLNMIYGGTLKDNKKFICEDVDFNNYDPTCPLLKNITATNFHYCFSDIVIPNKKTDVHVFASIIYNNKKLDCGFEFEKNRVYGSMFHPEYYDNTDQIFNNFYEICKKW
jgi:GMP synthase-like glutamine amidotransferase